MTASVERYVRLLWQPGDVREVRVPKADGYRTHAGYFDDPATLADAASLLDGGANIYITINPVDPALLARALNRITRLDSTTSDKDILNRRWLPIDIDPKRPSGISATGEEVENAKVAADLILKYLEAEGWGRPIVSLSGNGYQLLYPIDLPNDQQATTLVAGALGHLAGKFGSDSVTIDTTVSNAARIMCLVGTKKVKGDSTPERPHRLSELIDAPDELAPISLDVLSALVPATNRTRANAGARDSDRGASGWVRNLLDKAQIVYREQPPDAAGIIWYGLEHCPYHPDDGEPWQCGVGQAPDGRATGKCFHDRGVGKGWRDFKSDLGLDATRSSDEEPKGKGPTQGELIREAVDEAQVEFFHDSEFRAYASFEREDHRETWPIKSQGFRRYVSWLMYQKTGKAPRAGDLADFLALIEGRAQFDGEMRRVHVRIAPTDDGLAVDLGDAEWSVIKVDASGWRHVARPDVRFTRPRGMLPLPTPERGGSIDLLRPFVNVAKDAWLLLVGFLLMMFRPTGPFPILGVHGQQGAAKSTLMRVLRQLVDPRAAMDRAAPRNEHDLAIHALHHRVIALDNLSSLPDWLSDALARLATGAGFSTRQLYSDADEFSFSAARPVMLNGIGEVISRSDLLDRAVLIDLAPIPETQRRLEANFWADFDEARPQIFGALLDALSVAIKRESTITMDSWPRMADFARWVTAAEPGLGWEDGSFLKAYYANRGSAHEMALDADPVAVAVRDLMEKTSYWEGRPTELLTKLANIAGEEVTRRKDWPGAAHVLSNRLERLAPNLRAIGIEVERDRDGNNRTIRLSKPGDAQASEGRSGASPPSPASPVSDGDLSSPDADDAGDAGSRPSDNGVGGDASSIFGDVLQ